MQASKLRHRIKFYRQTAVRSATGALKVGKWEHILTLWGQFSHLSAKDVITAQAASTDVIARATIRYRTDIDHKMRVEHGGQMYEITGVPLADNSTAREYLTLLLKAVS